MRVYSILKRDNTEMYNTEKRLWVSLVELESSESI